MQQPFTPYAGTYFNASKMNKVIMKDTTFIGTVDGINKSTVGLGNVDNTSDMNKPISIRTQYALNTKASIEFVNDKLNELVGGAPDTLNTLKELSNAINNNPAFSDYVSLKANIADPFFSGNVDISGNLTVGNVDISGNLTVGNVDIINELTSTNETVTSLQNELTSTNETVTSLQNELISINETVSALQNALNSLTVNPSYNPFP